MNAAEPRVSIIIPAFNAASTINGTLDCLKRQSVADWEAIVIDDGSSDDTADLVRRHSAEDQRVSLIQRHNGGVSAARNTGIEVARAPWLVFLDADDWLAPEHLARLLTAVESNPGSSGAYCGYARVRSDHTPIMTSWSPEIAERPFEVFAERTGAAIHCFLSSRDLVRSVGGFDVGLATCEDWDLWLRIARTGARLTGVPEILAFYRTGEASLSSDVRRMVRDAARVIALSREPDPRVAPDPRYADGVQKSGAGGLALFVIWCIAHQAAKGIEATGLLDEIAELPDLLPPGDIVRDTIRDGLIVGGGVARENLPDVWSQAAPHLEVLAARLERLSGQAGIGRQILSNLERQILAGSTLLFPVTLSTWAGLRLDVRGPFSPFTPANGVDGIYCLICAGEDVLGTVEIPVYGVLSPAALAGIVIDAIGARTIAKKGNWFTRPAFSIALGREYVRAAPRLSVNMAARLLGLRRQHGSVHSEIGQRTITVCLGQRGSMPTAQGSNERALRLIEEETVGASDRAVRDEPADQAKPRTEAGPGDRKQYWEKFFEKVDPWDYESAYERGKYERTLALLGDEAVGNALELACAEGIFTDDLAPRVGNLIAADISDAALIRARERCRELRNIEFRQLDLVDHKLPANMDLIICSEVLYYLKDRAQLTEVACKIRDALAPGGRFVTAHAFVLTDEQHRTGFDWGHPFGATGIAEAFSATEGLALEKSIQTELYRIDLFRRTDNLACPYPAITVMTVDAPLTVDVERYLVRDGAILRRSEAVRFETSRVPVLAYHRVSEDGPGILADYRVSPRAFAEQMRFLRRRGYHAISSSDLAQHRRSRAAMRGRPVLITFDDGYRDFIETAWPILRRNDFTAEVFLPTDLIGAEAEWDRDGNAAAAPLMNWEEVRVAHRQGAQFGSHLASHTPATALSAEALLREGARSRAVIERQLDCTPHSVALPYGAYDERAIRILLTCGYTQIFTTEAGFVRTDEWSPIARRITVRGGDTIEDFSRHFEYAEEGNPV